MKIYDIKFSDVEWGSDEAKNDDALDTYFVEFPGYEDIIRGKKRFIVGRKGTGKTAVLQRIRMNCDENATAFYRNITLRDFPLNDFRGMEDRSYQNKSKYVAAWKFLILVEISKIIVEDQSLYGDKNVLLLEEFMMDNSFSGISMADTIVRIKENGYKVTIGEKIGLSLSKKSERQTEEKVHYNRVIEKLESILSKIEIRSTYYLLIDELDEGYSAKKSGINQVLLALLRAVDEVYYFFNSKGLSCIPVTVLRSDIYDNLEDNDLNKLDDYILRLNWSTSEESPWSLKQVVERRVEAALNQKYPDHIKCDYWRLIAEENAERISLWQYMCALTFSRPRDIIKLLKYCVSSERLTLSEVQMIENDYSDWFYREFKDEVQSFMGCWKGALNCISEVAKGKAPLTELKSKLSNNEGVDSWCTENNREIFDVIRILFEYSVIGCINSEGRWIFKYKDEYFEFMNSYPYYCVHYGFCRKLRIPKTYDKIVIEATRRYK